MKQFTAIAVYGPVEPILAGFSPAPPQKKVLLFSVPDCRVLEDQLRTARYGAIEVVSARKVAGSIATVRMIITICVDRPNSPRPSRKSGCYRILGLSITCRF